MCNIWNGKKWSYIAKFNVTLLNLKKNVRRSIFFHQVFRIPFPLSFFYESVLFALVHDITSPKMDYWSNNIGDYGKVLYWQNNTKPNCKLP